MRAPTVRAPPRLIHLSVGLIVQLLLGARTNHVHPLVLTTNALGKEARCYPQQQPIALKIIVHVLGTKYFRDIASF